MKKKKKARRVPAERKKLKIKSQLKAGRGGVLIEDSTTPTSGDFPGADIDGI